MAKTRAELQAELDESQNFIDACDGAIARGLGLNEETYDKYTAAMERQKEISQDLDVMNEQELGIRTSAQFLRKEPEMQMDECEITKIIELPYEEFDFFKTHLLADFDFISDNKDSMYVDKSSVTHCLLVLGEGTDDGILVDSQGASYARYSALLPNARMIAEMSMERMEGEEIRHAGENDRVMRIADLLNCNLEDVHIVDADEEHDATTIAELNRDTLTEEGKRAWADVLAAKVSRIYEGFYGTQIEVSGCPVSRLDAFSKMLAGCYSIEESEKWLNSAAQEESFEMKFSEEGGLR